MTKRLFVMVAIVVLASAACAVKEPQPEPDSPPRPFELNPENADFFDVPIDRREFKLDTNKYSVFVIDGPPTTSLFLNSEQGPVASWRLKKDIWVFTGWIEGSQQVLDLPTNADGFAAVALQPVRGTLLIELGLFLAPEPPPPVTCGQQQMRGFSSDWYTVRDVCDLEWIATLEKSAAKRDGRERCAKFCTAMMCTASIPRLRATATQCMTVAPNHHTRSARTNPFTCTFP